MQALASVMYKDLGRQKMIYIDLIIVFIQLIINKHPSRPHVRLQHSFLETNHCFFQNGWYLKGKTIRGLRISKAPGFINFLRIIFWCRFQFACPPNIECLIGSSHSCISFVNIWKIENFMCDLANAAQTGESQRRKDFYQFSLLAPCTAENTLQQCNNALSSWCFW
jgi:hypothetical protein